MPTGKHGGSEAREGEDADPRTVTAIRIKFSEHGKMARQLII
jgi:hypothetical protein